MKQIIYLLTGIFLALSSSSCIFSPTINGNGNVVEQERNLNDFDKIKASRGMNVYITQGDVFKVVVKADENLLEAIETDVMGDVLEIKTSSNIRRAKEKKVFVTLPEIESIKASAGSNVYSENDLVAKVLDISASAGSNIRLSIKTGETNVGASAGSNISLEGQAEDFHGKASAGSNIKAGELKTANTVAKVSAGANIWINSQNMLKANASSGGNVFYNGDPANTEINKSSGGNVIKN
ncbi:head GIN domain-containing protein [Draconibacterium sp. IB214405]|uniref:head GIN domain-containing protein n=1 Tax=Draconibacterium sp. IB214405 TaxID=3097352 RepID=UPI002A1632D0|nr:head GIN domain-containing protein [Draconibacterium sp. IB214405]MDX8338083.1 head GIN domain-containing protein [Draconibacterium sp. IB214405]